MSWREIMGVSTPAIHTHNPQNPPSSPLKPSSADIAYENQIADEVPRSNREEARGLIQTCKEYGIGLRLEPDGTLVVESNGKAWRALVRDIETNVEHVAELIALGFDGTEG